MSSVVQFSIFSSHKAFDKTCPDEVTRVTTPVDAESTVAQLKRNLWSLSTRTKCWNGASPFTSCWDSAQMLHFFLQDLHEEGWSKLWQTMRQRCEAFHGFPKRFQRAQEEDANGQGGQGKRRRKMEEQLLLNHGRLKRFMFIICYHSSSCSSHVCSERFLE